MTPVRVGLGLAFALLIGQATPVLAHDPGLSSARVRVLADAIEVDLAFNNADVAGAVPADADRDRVLSPDEIALGEVALLAFATDNTLLSANGTPARLQSAAVALADNGDVSYHLTFDRPSGATITFLQRALRHLPRGHREFVALLDSNHSVLSTGLLSASEPEFSTEISATVTPDRAAQAVQFSLLGVEHILIGYDHILFLLALLLVGGRFRNALAIITAFTVAHSLTLVLASLDLVRLPSALVEAVIAASIVWVAVQNVIQKQPRHRWQIAFAFGLVHGFGFASVLRELGLADAGGVVVPLISFNLGVEIGQVAIAAVALPIVWRLHRSAFFRDRGTAVLSAMVGLVGVWWLLERTVMTV